LWSGSRGPIDHLPVRDAFVELPPLKGLLDLAKGGGHVTPRGDVGQREADLRTAEEPSEMDGNRHVTYATSGLACPDELGRTSIE
jgi:hypothetical protein